MRTFSILFLILGIIFNAQAQEKPLKRHSKKQLIAMLEKEQLKSDSLNLVLKEERGRMNSLEKDQLELIAERKRMQSELEEGRNAKLSFQQKYEELNKQYVGLCEAPPKEVEVLDLYSFGYQPLQYSEREYKKQLKIARENVEKFRMSNVLDLIRLLQSHKVEDEMKNLLFQTFKRAYQGYFDGMTQAQLTFYNPKIETSLKIGIRQKTFKEIDQIEKENSWIQLLESY